MARADDGREQGAGDDFRRVAGLARIVTLLVIETAGNFVGDVLVERPAGFDGEQLHAAADAEHRDVGRQRCPQQALLERSPPRLERPHPRAGICAVELGGNVECAARDHEPVAETQRFLHRRRIVRIRQHHGKPTCREHGVRICLLQLVDRQRRPPGTRGAFADIRRHADDRSHRWNACAMARVAASGSEAVQSWAMAAAHRAPDRATSRICSPRLMLIRTAPSGADHYRGSRELQHGAGARAKMCAGHHLRGNARCLTEVRRRSQVRPRSGALGVCLQPDPDVALDGRG